MPSSYLLEDSSSNFWLMTVDDLGVLYTQPSIPGTVASLVLNDPLEETTWQVGISTTGILFTTPLALSPSEPTAVALVSVSGSSSWLIGVTSLGQLTTQPGTLSAPATAAAFTGTAYLIPLINQPQTLTITLAGVQYILKVVWNNVSQCWVMDIADSSGNNIATGIPLVTGADLAEQFGYLNFGGMFIAQTTNDTDAVPTFEDLGNTGNLYFVVGG